MISDDLNSEELKLRLTHAEETIRAIHYGEVDAVVVTSAKGPQVYALQSADHPYRVLVEQMHEGTVTIGLDGLILYSNPHFATLLDLQGRDVAGTPLQEHLDKGDLSAFDALMEAAMIRGHSSGDLNLCNSDNELVPVRLSLTQLDADGLQCVSVLVSDMREQLHIEAILKEEQLSRLILDQAGEAVVVVDPGGAILRRSESAKTMTGTLLLLEHFDQAFPLTVAGRPVLASDIIGTARGNESLRGVEASLTHADGRTSAVLLSASPLWKADELLGCVITLTDITELRRAKDVLFRQAEELARSNSDLRQFAYSASHDLREPLRQLAVFAELIEKKFAPSLGDEGQDLIHHSVDAAHRMEKLLQDLLAYIQSADAPQEGPARTDANEVVRKVLHSFEERIAQSGARVECGVLPVVAVHEVHLIQLFQNMISNALKYRNEGTPEIRISADGGPEQWRICVEDNGIGIAPDYQTQVFGLFQRLHGGGKYSGSGIGLAICQKIVQRYGCKIWVESELGRGSRFCFTLPGEAS